MSETGEGQSKYEVDADSDIPVRLLGLESKRTIRADLSIGRILGEGESGIVREARIKFTRGEKEREYPVAIKTYRRQDAERKDVKQAEVNMVRNRNEAYREQLVYYEALRRIGVNVIPTFRLAQGEDGNILGIVMTNLETSPLDAKSKVSRVTTTKTDMIGGRLTSTSRGRDLVLARNIGLALEADSWMLQYSSRWSGLGLLVPQPVVSDLIGVRIEKPHLFNTFLLRGENRDLKAEAKNTALVLKLI